MTYRFSINFYAEDASETFVGQVQQTRRRFSQTFIDFPHPNTKTHFNSDEISEKRQTYGFSARPLWRRRCKKFIARWENRRRRWKAEKLALPDLSAFHFPLELQVVRYSKYFLTPNNGVEVKHPQFISTLVEFPSKTDVKPITPPIVKKINIFLGRCKIFFSFTKRATDLMTWSTGLSGVYNINSQLFLDENTKMRRCFPKIRRFSWKIIFSQWKPWEWV